LICFSTPTKPSAQVSTAVYSVPLAGACPNRSPNSAGAVVGQQVVRHHTASALIPAPYCTVVVTSAGNAPVVVW